MITRQTLMLLPLVSLQLAFSGCCTHTGVRWPHGLACHQADVQEPCDETACVMLPSTVDDYYPAPAVKQPRAPEPPPEIPGLQQPIPAPQPTPAAPELPAAPSFDAPLPQSKASEPTPPGLIPLANAAKLLRKVPTINDLLRPGRDEAVDMPQPVEPLHVNARFGHTLPTY